MQKTNSKKNHSNMSQLAQEKNMPKLFSVRELAFYLHKSVRWVHMENSAGRLPSSIKLGRSRFWLAEDIETWLRSKMGRGVMPI